MIYGILALCMVNVMASETSKTKAPAPTNTPAPKDNSTKSIKKPVEKKTETSVDESKKQDEKVAELQKELDEKTLALAKKAAAKTPKFRTEEEKKQYEEKQQKKLEEAAKETVKVLSPAIMTAYHVSNGWVSFDSSKFDQELAKIIADNADALVNTLDADRLVLAQEAKEALQEQANRKATDGSMSKSGSIGFQTEEEKKQYEEKQKKLEEAAKETVKVLSPAIMTAYHVSNGWVSFDSSKFDQELAKIIADNADALVNTLDADRLALALALEAKEADCPPRASQQEGH